MVLVQEHILLVPVWRLSSAELGGSASPRLRHQKVSRPSRTPQSNLSLFSTSAVTVTFRNTFAKVCWQIRPKVF